MRYNTKHKDQTRQLLLKAAAAEVKRNGFAATGVDQLMKSAGLTGGALYAHFSGKAALLESMVDVELQNSLRLLTDEVEESAEVVLKRCLNRYLTMEHVRNLEQGCILPALAAELGRAGPVVRGLVDREYQNFVDFWFRKLGRQDAGAVLISQCVGAILMARMLADETKQQVLLQSVQAFLVNGFLGVL